MYNKSYLCKSLVHITELDLETINSKSKRSLYKTTRTPFSLKKL